MEKDGGDVELWNIYCDYLEENEHPQAEATRIWIQRRTSALSESAKARTTELAKLGLRPLLPRRVNSVGIELVFVPRGTFWMSEDEKNAQREVTLEEDFYLGIYPVTQGKWQQIMGNNPSGFSRTGECRGRVKDISDEDLPNPLGVHDMHGNVWEWCQDEWGSDRVIRGGCWLNEGEHCRAALHATDDPWERSECLGFRLAGSSIGESISSSK